jgi:hypothetical protein
MYVIEDAGQRSDAIEIVRQARVGVQSLAEFAEADNQRAAIDELVQQEILPALDRLEALLRQDAADTGVLESMRDESRTLAGRAGGMVRGAARSIGSNAERVLTVWNLGEKIWNLIDKIPNA